MLTIIDYGLGNINSFINIFHKLNIPVKKAYKEEDLKQTSKIILPGVGSFDNAMKRLIQSGMISHINSMVLENQIPILGICVGMQIMAKNSEEGSLEGLSWFDANVKHLSSHSSWENNINKKKRLPLPHMGWNDITVSKSSKLLDNLPKKDFYFLHSYYVELNNYDNELASCNYPSNITCAINKKNIYGIQFHPEKSHLSGIKLLENFANIDLC